MSKKKNLKARIQILERKNSELMKDVMVLVGEGNNIAKHEIKMKYRVMEEVKQMLLFGNRTVTGKLNNGLFDLIQKENDNS